jgi:hypothetical protein
MKGLYEAALGCKLDVKRAEEDVFAPGVAAGGCWVVVGVGVGCCCVVGADAERIWS